MIEKIIELILGKKHEYRIDDIIIGDVEDISYSVYLMDLTSGPMYFFPVVSERTKPGRKVIFRLTDTETNEEVSKTYVAGPVINFMGEYTTAIVNDERIDTFNLAGLELLEGKIGTTFTIRHKDRIPQYMIYRVTGPLY